MSQAALPTATDPARAAAANADGVVSCLQDGEVAALLGRPPAGPYRVVVYRDGHPAVLENGPFLWDGTPMPTLYWLVDPPLREAVSRLEATGGVRQADVEVDAVALTMAHARYAALRDGAVAPEHAGPRPRGGVGGTRVGVKCLHAHLAWWLAGGSDPVGEWVVARLDPSLLRPLHGAGSITT